ncbi:hypothetical protein RA28_10545 [Ruegeria sp. ANG-S4]|uniref:ParB/RepB/Spo0J family partition protein n=1 Tax=Ruegeria sp. ANG-S4 TaxID=1577904 RepID=UPI000580436A|nr:ParB N-terminal domain-containing protein [Ruegeria sp. ANG-S4]KIC45510.1 hypothetical protein RA28_10545 [Ruegeria sp. ANG-S4]
MAKRKRLTPARSDLQPVGVPGTAPETKSMFPPVQSAPPIAQVAGDTALQAAVDDLSAEIRTARAEGRLVQQVPLTAIEETHLVRDRIAVDGDEMTALIESIRARGQQTPIEVVKLAEGRFGLISGWRRLTALKTLHAETDEDRFATVQALHRRPEGASDAYLAMVEENEIRVGLSYYERARIAARAAEQGVYADEGSALRSLFSTASRAKRSKIGSFIVIYQALDEDLRFAASIPERLGLALSKALKDDQNLSTRIAQRLSDDPPESADDEAKAIAELISDVGRNGRPQMPAAENSSNPAEVIAGIRIQQIERGQKLVLSGDKLDAGFIDRLKIWLETQAD